MNLPPLIADRVRIDPGGCWEWLGTKRRDGYGILYVDGRQFRAHRFIYELLMAVQIPREMSLDHTCHSSDLSCRDWDECPHRRCVNPDHLEVVTQAENASRGRRRAHWATECPQGHPYDEKNTGRRGDGSRYCKACSYAHTMRRRALEPKKGKANLGRHNAIKTHCKYGHEFTPENTYTPPGTNSRYCRECDRARGRVKAAKRSAKRKENPS